MSAPAHSKHGTLVGARTVAFSLLALGLFIFILLALPFLLKTDAVSAILVQQIEHHLGHKVEVGSLHFQILPRIGLELHGMRVLDSVSNDRIFSAQRMELVLYVLPLLRGQFIGKRLVVERPHLKLGRDDAGHWTILPDGQQVPPQKTPTANPLALFALVRNVLLTDGRVTLVDESDPEARRDLQITAVQAIVSEGMPGRTAELQLFGEIPNESQAAAVFALNGTLIQTHSEGDEDARVQLDGKVRVDRIDVRQLADWSGFGPVGDGFHGLTHISGQFRLAPRPIGYDLIVSEWAADVADVSLRGDLRFIGLGAEAPTFSATVSSSPLRLQRWVEQVPTQWKPARLQTMLAEHEVDALVALHAATVTGRLGAKPNTAVKGEVEVRDGRFLLGDNHPWVHQLSARVLYQGSQVRVVDLKAGYGPVLLSHGDVLVTNLDTEPTVDARVSGKAPADGLINLLNQVFQSSQTEMLAGHVQQATGRIEVAAHIAGRPFTGGHLDVLEADVTIDDVGFRDPALPVPIQHVNGRLGFSSGTIHIDTLSGHVGPARLDARGSIKIGGQPPYQDLTLDMTADARELAQWLHLERIRDSKPDIEGVIRLAATVSGALPAPRIKGHLHLEQAALGIPNIFTKPMGAPASIEFSGEMSNDRVLSVHRLDVLLPPIRIAGQGRIRLSNDFDFEGKVISDSIALEKLPKGISLGPVEAGRLDAMLAMKGHATDRTSWHTSGRIRFDNGVIVAEGLKDAIRNVSVHVQLDDHDITITRLALKMGGSDLRASGSIAEWTGAPQATLVVEASQFDLQLLQAAAGQSSQGGEGPAFLKRWLAGGRFGAMVFINDAYYQKFLFTDLSCRVTVNHGVLTVDRISADTNDGHLGGRLVVRSPERRLGRVESAFRISGIPIERITGLFLPERAIKGWLSATGQLQAELGGAGPLAGSMTSTRPVRLIVKDGRIFEVPVISNLLKVMNLPALLQGQVDLTKEGMLFDELRGVFSVANGTITFKELFLDSPILKISGSGRYDFMADQLDMVLATSPLGSYSNLLKKIPLFGKLFAGEREGFDTAVFEVKGPAKDPSLQYLPAESFMRGVKGTARLAFDVLVNAITLPKELYTQAEEFLAGEDE